MKYRKEKKVNAVYSSQKGNPFLEAMPELLSKKTFFQNIQNDYINESVLTQSPEERRRQIIKLSEWFYPLDYMYRIYDMLYHSILSSYQSQTTVEFVKQLNRIYKTFQNQELCSTSDNNQPFGTYSASTFSTQAQTGAILGIPGIGKTSTIKRCLDLIPQVIVHSNYRKENCYMRQINYLMVECPSDCSVKTLAFNILSAIDRAVGSNYFETGLETRKLAVSALSTKLKLICMNHHVGIIVIDEIQNVINTAEKSKQIKPLIRFLVELTNDTSTAICFCGTLEAEELFLEKEHLKRRTRGLRLLPMKYDLTYRKFMEKLWRKQVLLNPGELSEKMMKQIFDLSGGIPAYIIKIFQEAQIQAIFSGKETITYQEIKEAVDLLCIEVPRYYADHGTSISDFHIKTIEFEEKPVVEKTISEEEKVKIVNKKEEKPKRLTREYATKRGRPEIEREEKDLLYILKRESKDSMIKTLMELDLLERKYFEC